MSVNDEEQNEEQTATEDIPHIQDKEQTATEDIPHIQDEEETETEDIPEIREHRCLAILAFCFFFPLGYLAYRSSQKTRLYKEQKEYEKAKATSKFTFIYILSSITGGAIILFCLLFRFFYM